MNGRIEILSQKKLSLRRFSEIYIPPRKLSVNSAGKKWQAEIQCQRLRFGRGPTIDADYLRRVCQKLQGITFR